MKRFPLFLSAFFCLSNLHSQNVGIGITSPTAKLHVGDGTVRIEGPASAGGNALSIGGFGDVQVDAFGSAGGRFLVKENGNVGIGNTAPGYPLNFATTTGDKISFWGNTGPHYGMGLQPGLLQLHTDGATSDIAFGYGSSGSFTERMRIKGNGNMGIGNSNPAYLLDVSQRMRIRSGGNNFSSAGLWLNNNANTEAAFIGMEDDTHIGLFGSTAGWKFGMNTQTGALRVDGSEGQAGKVLASSGGSANTWISPTNFIYNNCYTALQTSNVSSFTGYVEIPGIARTIATPKCKAQIILKGNIQNVACFGCGGTSFKFDLVIDGVLVDRSICGIGNGGELIVTNGAYIADLAAGSHTFSVFVDGNSSSHSAGGFRMVIVLFPE
jgi:hypothetical protein